MSYRILVVNPGSTTTKIAVYDDSNAVITVNVEHDTKKLAEFAKMADQAPYRMEYISKALADNNIDESTIDCIMCRGGLVYVPPIKSGGYIVNEDLYIALADEKLTATHASLLGGRIGKQFSDKLGVPAYIYDAPSAGELTEVGKITGFTDIVRRGTAHVLNARSMAIRYAESVGKKAKDMNIIVGHMGGGCSVTALKHGVLIETIGDDELHMSAERAGGAPLVQFTELCYSGKYTEAEMKKILRGKGGMFAHLGTADGRAAEKMVAEGNEKAKLVLNTISYGMSKSIGALSGIFKEKIDVIILTGGLAHSKIVTEEIKAYVSPIAPVEILPGESEMIALAEGGIRIMKGEEEAMVYKLPEGYQK
ncbi:MAG: butyrate kinase [Eubacteriales bacterium]|nr:butyrate kinase [Eubacteriales bacterium]MDD4390410.1 butyrate kinase [Eubacteriales bacterium]